MSVPLSSTGPAAESSAWQELEEVLAELGAFARTQPPPNEFYRYALNQTVRALSAVGGAVWLRGNGLMQPVARNNWHPEEMAADERTRSAHEAVLSEVAASGRIVSVAPHNATHEAHTGNPTDCLLLVAPVRLRREGASDGNGVNDSAVRSAAATLAIIEILARPDASPSAYRGQEQFLIAVCELAADYHSSLELERLRKNDAYRDQLLRLGRVVHRQLDLQETAYAVANDGRAVIECDRLSVLLTRGRRCRLLATSGAQRVERRSNAARHLEKLGETVCRTREPAFYADGQCDALPQVADALEHHAEASQARQIAVVPVCLRDETESDDARRATAKQSRRGEATFILVAEQFDAQHGELHRERLVEVADVSATALANALAIDRLPLVWLLRPLGVVKQRATERWTRTALAIAGVAAAVAALVFVQADFNIEATGTLQPVVRRAAFAPRSGLVEAVLVKHGEDVAADQPLLRLRDPALELETKRVHGELETAQRQIEAVRATKTGRSIRDVNPIETYRLSAEERELDQRLTNLRQELDLLNEETEKLVVASPIAGRVLTWDVAGRLMARPVERGEELIVVADIGADWQLELDVPDDRIGHVIAAQQEFGAELPVRFRLSSDDRELAAADGRVAEVCQTADLNAEPGARPLPEVRVNVALDVNQFSDAARHELRPGVSARAQIECGQRSVGYVWLHDIWDAAIGWVRF